MSGLGFNPRAVETQRGSIPPQWRKATSDGNAFFFCGCACWESNPGHKHGRLVCCHYTTCAYAARQSKGPNFQRLMLHFASGAQRSSSPTGKLTHPDDTLAEWLRRRPAKPMGSPCVGSNPTGVVLISHPLAAREGGFFFQPTPTNRATRREVRSVVRHRMGRTSCTHLTRTKMAPGSSWLIGVLERADRARAPQMINIYRGTNKLWPDRQRNAARRAD